MGNFTGLPLAHPLMFIEPGAHAGPAGWIEVICGSMFSGKTEELLRRLRRAQIAGQAIRIFKPVTDTRYSHTEVVSHDQNAIESETVLHSKDILAKAIAMQVVGIDEAQFLDEEIVAVANELANAGKRVIISGLDMDFKGRPFGPMPQLLATAEYVTKLHAICTRTGGMAHYSYRRTPREGQIMLGAQGEYEPLSRSAFVEAMRQRDKAVSGGHEQGSLDLPE